MKRFICIVCLAALCLVMLCGCSQPVFDQQRADYALNCLTQLRNNGDLAYATLGKQYAPIPVEDRLFEALRLEEWVFTNCVQELSDEGGKVILRVQTGEDDINHMTLILTRETAAICVADDIRTLIDGEIEEMHYASYALYTLPDGGCADVYEDTAALVQWYILNT